MAAYTATMRAAMDKSTELLMPARIMFGHVDTEPVEAGLTGATSAKDAGDEGSESRTGTLHRLDLKERPSSMRAN